MKWWRQMRRKANGKFSSFLATLRTAKRAMARPDAKSARQAVIDTFQLLTTPRAPGKSLEDMLWDDDRIPAMTKAELVEEVRRTAREIFHNVKFEAVDTMKPFVPSTNSNYLTTRSEGGAVGALLESEEFQRFKCKAGEHLINYTEEGATWRSQRVKFDDTKLLSKWNELFEELMEGAMKEEKCVTLQALAEALKLRVISKGPWKTYTVLKPVQLWMWETLFNHKSGVFRLIGEEINGEYLEKQLGPLKGLLESFLSGDYSAATDNVDPDLSNAVVDEISKSIFDPRLSELLKSSLTGHKIRNPEKPDEMKEQMWGQLMGSVVSFPILCIINASICRRVRESQVRRRLTLSEAQIAINGDDCVFRCDEDGRIFWEVCAEASGMKPSVGKYFFSREFLNMNSAEYVVVDEFCLASDLKRDGTPDVHFLQWTPRINMGLMAGMGRSTSGKMEKCSGRDWGTANSISINAHTLVNECFQEDRERVFNCYLNTNWEILSSVRLPWFLPEHLGGLGLPIFPNYTERISQEEFKKRVKKSPEFEKKVLKDTEGYYTRPWAPTTIDLRFAAAYYEYGRKVPKRPAGVAWKIWDYALQRMSKRPTVTIQNYLEGQTESYRDGNEGFRGHINIATERSRFCVEALFTQPIEKLYRESQEENKTLRKMEEEQKRLKSKMQLVRPFELDKLPKAPDFYDEPQTVVGFSPQSYHRYQQKELVDFILS